MMRRPVVFALAWLLSLGAAGIQAQSLRDPTLPPPEMGTSPVTPPALGTFGTGAAVIVRDGKSYVVAGTRLYAPGQTVGTSRVERITETEVWLREGTVLRKVPRFAGIQRSTVASTPACGNAVAPKKSAKTTALRAQPSRSAKARTSSSTAPQVAPCDGAQP